MQTIPSCYLPPGFTPESPVTQSYEVLSPEQQIEHLILAPSDLTRLCRYLKAKRRELLLKHSIETIVEILDKIAVAALQHQDISLMRAISHTTHLSVPMVMESIRREQVSSRGADLRKALKSEFGIPEMLDHFCFNPITGNQTRALGSDLVLTVLPGNIPGLSHLSIMRCLLVKSACLGKVASSEPLYAAAYCQLLQQQSPELAECVAMLHWTGGDDEFESIVLEEANRVIVYGTDATCDSILKRTPPQTPVISHRHKTGFAYLHHLSVAKDSNIAKKMAEDVALYDGYACLSPRWIFYEVSEAHQALELAEELAVALRCLETKLPKGSVSAEEASAFGQLWDAAEEDALLTDDVHIVSKRQKDRFLVLVDSGNKLRITGPGRCACVVPVSGMEDVQARLQPMAPHLQNMALAVPAAQQTAYAEFFFQQGVLRICPPGGMATPSMMWHHDGIPCLSQLTSFCDQDNSVTFL